MNRRLSSSARIAVSILLLVALPAIGKDKEDDAGLRHLNAVNADIRTSRKNRPAKAAIGALGALAPRIEQFQPWNSQLPRLMSDWRMDYVKPDVHKALEDRFNGLRDQRSEMLPNARSVDADADALASDTAAMKKEAVGLKSEGANLAQQIGDHDSRCNPAPDDDAYQQCVAEGQKLRDWQNDYNARMDDFNARLDTLVAREKRIDAATAEVGGAIETWQERVHRLIDDILKELEKVNTGDCTEEQHRKLQDEVDRACKRPRACKGDMECPDLLENLAKNRECAAARKNINDTCYRGGDPGHKQALDEALNAIANCLKFMKKKGCGDGGGVGIKPSKP